MNQVRIQPQAQEEAEQAAVWYETQQTGLGIEFILELDTAVERAAESPEMYAMQYREAQCIKSKNSSVLSCFSASIR